MTEQTEHQKQLAQDEQRWLANPPVKAVEVKPVAKPAPPKRPAPKKRAPAKVTYDAAYLHGVLKHYRLVLREPFGRAFVVGTGEGETIELRGFPENVPGRRDEWDFFDPPTLFIADRAYPVTNP